MLKPHDVADAKKLIYETKYQDGLKLGQKLGKMAKDRNDLLEFERLLISEYNKDYEFTVGFDDPTRDWKVKTKNKCSYTNCLSGGCEMDIPAVWKAIGLDDETIQLLGELSCIPYNLGVRKGFNPKIDFELEKLLPNGDPCCVWVEEIMD